MVTYIFSCFFNLVEKNLLRVKQFLKCHENGIACLRKGKYPCLVSKTCGFSVKARCARSSGLVKFIVFLLLNMALVVYHLAKKSGNFNVNGNINLQHYFVPIPWKQSSGFKCERSLKSERAKKSVYRKSSLIISN